MQQKTEKTKEMIRMRDLKKKQKLEQELLAHA